MRLHCHDRFVRKSPFTILVILSGLGFFVNIYAAATRVGFKDAFATARGNAFAATANTPAAVYYNPAGLTQLEGQSFSATAYVVQIESSYQGPAGPAAMDSKAALVPQFFYAWAPADEPYAFGLGGYAPFGLSTEWPANSSLRTFALKAEQKTYSIALAAALDLGGGFSIGGGPVFQRAETALSRGIFAPGDFFNFEGSGNSMSFNLGFRWEPNPRHAFGLSYQHHYSISLKGEANTVPYGPIIESASGNLEFPEIVIFGYSFRPSPTWNFEFNLDWTNWERVNNLVINKASGSTILPFNWQSGFFYDFGATHDLGGGLAVSGGYTFAENSIPDSTYIPGVPDADRHIFAIGGCYKTDATTFQLTCQYGFSPDRTVRGSQPNLFGATADGTYKNRLYAIAASFDYRF